MKTNLKIMLCFFVPFVALLLWDPSTDDLQPDGDGYVLSVKMYNSKGWRISGKERAEKIAEKHCNSQGQKLQVITFSNDEQINTVKLKFKCQAA